MQTFSPTVHYDEMYFSVLVSYMTISSLHVIIKHTE